MDYSGRIIDDRYRLIRLISRGGMGSVYFGRHVVIGRELAVKVLHPRFKDNNEMITRFYREAQSAALVKHRNVVDVFDTGVTEWGEPYLVMEYLAGRSVAEIHKGLEAPMSPEAVSGIIIPVLSALAAMHEKNIIHRDIKPDNIVIVENPKEPPTVKLIDFGISKLKQPEITGLTRTGSFLGTLDFMAPEQLRGVVEVTPAADLWAVAVVCYQLLTKRLPYVAPNFNALYAKILNDEPIPPQKASTDFPPEMVPIIEKALEKNPLDRYQTAVEMLRDIKALPYCGNCTNALAEVLALSKQTIDKVRVNKDVNAPNGGKRAVDSSLKEAYDDGDIALNRDASVVVRKGKKGTSTGEAPLVLETSPQIKTPNGWPISNASVGPLAKGKLSRRLPVLIAALLIGGVVLSVAAYSFLVPEPSSEISQTTLSGEISVQQMEEAEDHPVVEKKHELFSASSAVETLPEKSSAVRVAVQPLQKPESVDTETSPSEEVKDEVVDDDENVEQDKTNANKPKPEVKRGSGQSRRKRRTIRGLRDKFE